MAGNHPAMEGVDRNDALKPTPSFDWGQPICQFICNGAEDTLGSHYVHSFFANGSYAVANVSSDLPLGMFHISMMRIKHAVAAARQEGRVEGWQQAVAAQVLAGERAGDNPLTLPNVPSVLHVPPTPQTDDNWEGLADEAMSTLWALVDSLIGERNDYEDCLYAAQTLLEKVESVEEVPEGAGLPKLTLVKDD